MTNQPMASPAQVSSERLLQPWQPTPSPPPPLRSPPLRVSQRALQLKKKLGGKDPPKRSLSTPKTVAAQVHSFIQSCARIALVPRRNSELWLGTSERPTRPRFLSLAAPRLRDQTGGGSAHQDRRSAAHRFRRSRRRYHFAVRTKTKEPSCSQRGEGEAADPDSPIS